MAAKDVKWVSAWIHAFTYGYVEPRGRFWDVAVRLNDGVFFAEGRRYK